MNCPARVHIRIIMDVAGVRTRPKLASHKTDTRNHIIGLARHSLVFVFPVSSRLVDARVSVDLRRVVRRGISLALQYRCWPIARSLSHAFVRVYMYIFVRTRVRYITPRRARPKSPLVQLILSRGPRIIY